MSQTTKKMMSLELEFIDEDSHGFINWVDLMTGESLATLGLGSTGKDGGAKFLEWDLAGVDFIKITGGSIQFDKQRSLTTESTRDIYDEFGDFVETETYVLSQIKLNDADITDIEKANIIYPYTPPVLVDNEYIEQEQTEGYLRLEAIRQEYADKTNAMVFEHERSIAFVNPVSERLMGEIDMVGESFAWYGALALGDPVDDSLFETKRVDALKYNMSFNADTNNNPEIVFKKDDAVIWSIKVNGDFNNSLNIKNASGYGVELLNDEDAVRFTGEIYYQNTPLLDYFYTQDQLNNGVLDTLYYTEGEVDVLLSNLEATLRTELNQEINDLKNRVQYLEEQTGNQFPRYYVYEQNEWLEISSDIKEIDEEYDISLVDETQYIYVKAEKEQTYFKWDGSWTQQVLDSVQELPLVHEIDDVLIEDESRVYIWNGSDWSYDSSDSVDNYYIKELHLADVIAPIEGTLYKITSTDKYYLYQGGEFIESECPVLDLTYRPNSYDYMGKIVKI